MKKVLAAIAFLLGLSGMLYVITPDEHAPFVSEVRINLRDTVHVVTVLADDGSISAYGSGVMVAPQLMLTAAHISGEGTSHLRVGLEQAMAKVVKFNTKDDIAILQVPFGCPCAAIADAAPAVDTEVTAIGYPLFHAFAAQVRTVGHIQGAVASSKRMLFSASIVPGNSGGGLFAGGKLVGIVAEVAFGSSGMFSSYPVPHLGQAVDTVTMRDFYASYKPVVVDPKLNEYTSGRLTAVKSVPKVTLK